MCQCAIRKHGHALPQTLWREPTARIYLFESSLRIRQVIGLNISTAPAILTCSAPIHNHRKLTLVFIHFCEPQAHGDRLSTCGGLFTRLRAACHAAAGCHPAPQAGIILSEPAPLDLVQRQQRRARQLL